jgi:hypothetical protein
MARPSGSPLSRSIIKLYIPEECVLKSGKHRFVFVEIVSPKIHRLSVEAYKSNRLSQRFGQILHRRMYNTRQFYGLRAVDIDRPQIGNLPVSIELQIFIGEGKDGYEETV